MTIEGVIAQLQELIDNDGIPFWAKPSLQKVMETVKMEWEQHIKERKTGKWIIENRYSGIARCSECGMRKDTINLTRYCEDCGAKMQGREYKELEKCGE